MLKAIIFDIDGVLVDSREANKELYRQLFRKAGYPVPKDEDILRCFHLPLKSSIKELLGTQDMQEVERLFQLAQTSRANTAHLFLFPEKLVENLEHLRKRYKLAVVTSRIRIGAEEVFNTAEIGHLFDVAVTYEDYDNPKPHPEPLLTALEKLGLTAAEALYIGDSDTDIEAARDANMKSIHLTRKPHPDATASVAEFEELSAAIETLG